MVYYFVWHNNLVKYFLMFYFFGPLSLLNLTSQPSVDLRQFAKQEALQHTAIPAHLDRADENTLMHPNVHSRTHTHTLGAKTHMHKSSSASLGCRNRILEPLKIISDMKHAWLMSLPEHNIASVYTTFQQLLIQMQQMPQQNFHDRTISVWLYMCVNGKILKEAVVVWGNWLCRKSIWNWEPLCKNRFHDRDIQDMQTDRGNYYK